MHTDYSQMKSDINVVKKWVYGITCTGIPQPIQFHIGEQDEVPCEKIIYFTGCTVIIYYIQQEKQEYYSQHNDQIISLAQSQKNGLIATGENGMNPKIHIWVLKSLQTVNIIEGQHQNGVQFLNFIKNDSILVTGGISSFSQIIVYSVITKEIIYSKWYDQIILDLKIITDYSHEEENEENGEQENQKSEQKITQILQNSSQSKSKNMQKSKISKMNLSESFQSRKSNKKEVINPKDSQLFQYQNCFTLVFSDKVLIYLYKEGIFIETELLLENTGMENKIHCFTSYRIDNNDIDQQNKSNDKLQSSNYSQQVSYNSRSEKSQHKIMVIVGHDQGVISIWENFTFKSTSQICDKKQNILHICDFAQGIVICTENQLFLMDFNLENQLQNFKTKELNLELINNKINSIQGFYERIYLTTLGGDLLELDFEEEGTLIKQSRIDQIFKIVGNQINAEPLKFSKQENKNLQSKKTQNQNGEEPNQQDKQKSEKYNNLYIISENGLIQVIDTQSRVQDNLIQIHQKIKQKVKKQSIKNKLQKIQVDVSASPQQQPQNRPHKSITGNFNLNESLFKTNQQQGKSPRPSQIQTQNLQSSKKTQLNKFFNAKIQQDTNKGNLQSSYQNQQHQQQQPSKFKDSLLFNQVKGKHKQSVQLDVSQDGSNASVTSIQVQSNRGRQLQTQNQGLMLQSVSPTQSNKNLILQQQQQQASDKNSSMGQSLCQSISPKIKDRLNFDQNNVILEEQLVQYDQYKDSVITSFARISQEQNSKKYIAIGIITETGKSVIKLRRWIKKIISNTNKQYKENTKDFEIIDEFYEKLDQKVIYLTFTKSGKYLIALTIDKLYAFQYSFEKFLEQEPKIQNLNNIKDVPVSVQFYDDNSFILLTEEGQNLYKVDLPELRIRSWSQIEKINIQRFHPIVNFKNFIQNDENIVDQNLQIIQDNQKIQNIIKDEMYDYNSYLKNIYNYNIDTKGKKQQINLKEQMEHSFIVIGDIPVQICSISNKIFYFKDRNYIFNNCGNYLLGHGSSIKRIFFKDKNTFMSIGKSDGTIIEWEIQQNEELNQPTFGLHEGQKFNDLKFQFKHLTGLNDEILVAEKMFAYIKQQENIKQKINIDSFVNFKGYINQEEIQNIFPYIFDENFDYHEEQSIINNQASPNKNSSQDEEEIFQKNVYAYGGGSNKKRSLQPTNADKFFSRIGQKYKTQLQHKQYYSSQEIKKLNFNNNNSNSSNNLLQVNSTTSINKNIQSNQKLSGTNNQLSLDNLVINTNQEQTSEVTSNSKIIEEQYEDNEIEKISIEIEYIIGLNTGQIRNNVRIGHNSGKQYFQKQDYVKQVKLQYEYAQDMLQIPQYLIDKQQISQEKQTLIKQINKQNYYIQLSKLPSEISHSLCERHYIYFTSTYFVIHNAQLYQQQFYKEHQYPITCFDLHPNKIIVASSERSLSPLIHVWNILNLHSAPIKLETLHKNGVSLLKFDNTGDLILTVSCDQFNSIQITNWKNNYIQAFRNTGQYPIFDAIFNPQQNNEFITCTLKQITFWVIEQYCIVKKAVINTEKSMHIVECITCLCYLNYNIEQQLHSDLIAGNNHGQILFVAEDEIIVAKDKAHKDKMINIIKIVELFQDQTLIISGGQDQCVRIWNIHFYLLKEINLRENQIFKNIPDSKFNISPQSIDFYLCKYDSEKYQGIENYVYYPIILVGIRTGDIIEIEFQMQIKTLKKQEQENRRKTLKKLNKQNTLIQNKNGSQSSISQSITSSDEDDYLEEEQDQFDDSLIDEEDQEINQEELNFSGWIRPQDFNQMDITLIVSGHSSQDFSENKDTQKVFFELLKQFDILVSVGDDQQIMFRDFKTNLEFYRSQTLQRPTQVKAFNNRLLISDIEGNLSVYNFSLVKNNENAYQIQKFNLLQQVPYQGNQLKSLILNFVVSQNLDYVAISYDSQREQQEVAETSQVHIYQSKTNLQQFNKYFEIPCLTNNQINKSDVTQLGVYNLSFQKGQQNFLALYYQDIYKNLQRNPGEQNGKFNIWDVENKKMFNTIYLNESPIKKGFKEKIPIYMYPELEAYDNVYLENYYRREFMKNNINDKNNKKSIISYNNPTNQDLIQKYMSNIQIDISSWYTNLMLNQQFLGSGDGKIYLSYNFTISDLELHDEEFENDKVQNDENKLDRKNSMLTFENVVNIEQKLLQHQQQLQENSNNNIQSEDISSLKVSTQNNQSFKQGSEKAIKPLNFQQLQKSKFNLLQCQQNPSQKTINSKQQQIQIQPSTLRSQNRNSMESQEQIEEQEHIFQEKLYDLYKRCNTYNGHESYIYQQKVSQDLQYLFTTSIQDENIIKWKINREKQIQIQNQEESVQIKNFMDQQNQQQNNLIYPCFPNFNRKLELHQLTENDHNYCKNDQFHYQQISQQNLMNQQNLIKDLNKQEQTIQINNYRQTILKLHFRSIFGRSSYWFKNNLKYDIDERIMYISGCNLIFKDISCDLINRQQEQNQEKNIEQLDNKVLEISHIKSDEEDLKQKQNSTENQTDKQNIISFNNLLSPKSNQNQIFSKSEQNYPMKYSQYSHNSMNTLQDQKLLGNYNNNQQSSKQILQTDQKSIQEINRSKNVSIQITTPQDENVIHSSSNIENNQEINFASQNLSEINEIKSPSQDSQRVYSQDNIKEDTENLDTYNTEEIAEIQKECIYQLQTNLDIQEHIKHQQQISSLYQTLNKQIQCIATQQENAQLMIWNIYSNIYLGSITLQNTIAIQYMDISQNGKFLVCIALMKLGFQRIYYIDLKNLNILAFMSFSMQEKEKWKDIKFSNYNDLIFYLTGDQSIWQIKYNKNLLNHHVIQIIKEQSGIAQLVSVEQLCFTCITNFQGDYLVCGDNQGYIHIIQDRLITQKCEIYKSRQISINCIIQSQQIDSILITGSSNGQITIIQGIYSEATQSFQIQILYEYDLNICELQTYDSIQRIKIENFETSQKDLNQNQNEIKQKDQKKEPEYEIQQKNTSFNYEIQSLDEGSYILVGTRCGCVFELEKMYKGEILEEGENESSLYRLVQQGIDNYEITCAFISSDNFYLICVTVDGTLISYNLQTHYKKIWLKIDQQIFNIYYISQEDYIILQTENNIFFVKRQKNQLQFLQSATKCFKQQSISTIILRHDYQMLAVALYPNEHQKGQINIFKRVNTESLFELSINIEDINHIVYNIQFSQCLNFMQYDISSTEIQYYNLKNRFKLINPTKSDIDHIKWCDYKSTFGKRQFLKNYIGKNIDQKIFNRINQQYIQSLESQFSHQNSKEEQIDNQQKQQDNNTQTINIQQDYLPLQLETDPSLKNIFYENFPEIYQKDNNVIIQIVCPHEEFFVLTDFNGSVRLFIKYTKKKVNYIKNNYDESDSDSNDSSMNPKQNQQIEYSYSYNLIQTFLYQMKYIDICVLSPNKQIMVTKSQEDNQIYIWDISVEENSKILEKSQSLIDSKIYQSKELVKNYSSFSNSK